MAVFQGMAERLEGKGWWGVGIGAVILAPVLLRGAGKYLRPAAKEAIKGYLAVSDAARRGLGGAGEQMQDLVAEARAEFDARGNEPEGEKELPPARRPRKSAHAHDEAAGTA